MPMTPGTADHDETQQLGPCTTYSHRKLHEAAHSLRPWLGREASFAAVKLMHASSDDDCVGYRCRCSFQLLRSERSARSDNVMRFQYAIRKHQKPFVIQAFPVANLRIQRAMEGFLRLLNEREAVIPELSEALESVSFSSSWSGDCLLLDGDMSATDMADCVMTLNYNTTIDNTERWQGEAQFVCNELNLKQLTGRSKKRLLKALKNESSTLDDTIYIVRGTSDRPHHEWKVSLQRPSDSNEQDEKTVITVNYRKPEGAFFHPNARAMCRALEWMLGRLSTIVCSSSNSCSSLDNQPKRLLEMYCGCGAHTMVLSRSKLVDKIFAVEVDNRLVDALRENCESNSCTNIEIHLADAAQWAQRGLKDPLFHCEILLVDPPRQGLDAAVCQMAIQGNFQHILYISCGKEALLRDLSILENHFNLVDCQLLDLFPGTDAVESLVHLSRKDDEKTDV